MYVSQKHQFISAKKKEGPSRLGWWALGLTPLSDMYSVVVVAAARNWLQVWTWLQLPKRLTAGTWDRLVRGAVPLFDHGRNSPIIRWIVESNPRWYWRTPKKRKYRRWLCLLKIFEVDSYHSILIYSRLDSTKEEPVLLLLVSGGRQTYTYKYTPFGCSSRCTYSSTLCFTFMGSHL